MSNKDYKFGITAFSLRVIAMIAMVLDYTYKILGIGGVWMTAIGRIAFPIFAFQIVEGYIHTKNFKKYCLKMFLFALIIQIPQTIFVLITKNYTAINQNVLWTFFIGLCILKWIDIIREDKASEISIFLKTLIVCIFGYLLGNILRVDYYGIGILIIVMFYFSMNFKYKRISQLILLTILNAGLPEYIININILGTSFLFNVQLLAVASLIFIWLYNGKQGYYSKRWSNFCYWFYPIHLLI